MVTIILVLGIILGFILALSLVLMFYRRSGDRISAPKISSCSMLFLRILFPQTSSGSVEARVQKLHSIYSLLDQVLLENSVIKLESINTLYVAYCECTNKCDPILANRRIYQCCLRIPNIVKTIAGEQTVFQIGLHDGIIGAGVISKLNAKTSLVGDTINVAARLCFAAKHNSICLSQSAFDHFSDANAMSMEIKAKGKGLIKAYSVKLETDTEKLPINVPQTEITELDTCLLYADIVQYTQIADKLGVYESFQFLKKLYYKIDHICKKNGLCKIHTIGDCYAIASTCPACALRKNATIKEQACWMMQAAREIQETAHALIEGKTNIRMRVGIHAGKVYWAKVGVVESRYYDVFGDDVKVALELQNFCEPSKVILSQSVVNALDGAIEEDSLYQKNTKPLSQFSAMSYYI